MKKGKSKTNEESKRNDLEVAALQKVLVALEDGKAARTVDLIAEEREAGLWVFLCVCVCGWVGICKSGGTP